jgi:hypothetical protein
MNQLFLSYSRSDSAWTQALSSALVRIGVPVWIDQNDIPVSMRWLEEIHEAIEECGLFVTCVSNNYSASIQCETEAAIARECSKRDFRVDVSEEPQRAAERIAKAFRAIPNDALTRCELIVRSRAWERSGRSKRRLVGIRLRRRLESSMKIGDDSAVERAFLRACHRLQHRRMAVVIFSFSIVGVSVTAGLLFNDIQSSLTNANAAIVSNYEATNQAEQLTFDDPYFGLDAAAASGSNSAGVYSLVLAGALADPIPDRALTVPGGAKAFGSISVGPKLSLVTTDGKTWTTNADNTVVAPFGYSTVVGEVTAQHWSIRVEPNSGIIEVFRGPVLYRRFVVGGPPSAVAMSPDGRWLAVALGTEVDLVDVERGQVRQSLRGAPGNVTALAWGRIGNRIWAISAGRIVSWPTTDGRIILDQPKEWYQAVFASQSANRAWVVDRSGNLFEISLATGATVWRFDFGETVYSAAINSTNSEVVIVGANSDWLASLRTGARQRFHIKSCVSDRPVFSSNGRAIFVPCSEGSVLELSAKTGELLRKIPIPGLGAESVAIDSRNGALVVGGWTGNVYMVDKKYRVTLLESNICQPLTADVAVSNNGNDILPVGQPTGIPDCSYIGNRAYSGAWEWNAVIDSLPSSIGSNVALFDPSGSEFIIGYDDGTIVMHPTKSILPEVSNTTLVGEVRAMVVVNGRLLVATKAGILQSVSLCEACLSNGALAKEATSDLVRAHSLHLTTLRR